MKLLWKKSKNLVLKDSIDLTKMDFYALLVPTILSAEIFDKNIDLKVLVENFKVEKPIKDYLYDNRTALLARLIREIERSDEESLSYNILILNDFLDQVFKLSLQNDIELINAVKLLNKYSRNKV
ncbi:hypothetical protein JTI58_19035 [Lysinibacillus fusiformis]|uniref:hypothetical protein n=1 Tax=Lysinibacillus fusiformis TaxID=28031 RepID=UPI0019686D19|nr:hypothetical protein [Lysinibacillus fusiformis]QSB09089.1 hypothetical protein JTI58_19035 [Lysinibacillus fusiformis]